MAASPVYEECTEISTESEFSVEDDIYEERSNSDFAVQAHHGWPNYLTSASKKRPSAKCREYHCRRIKGIWSADSIDSFAEKVLSDLRIPEVTPMGLSQQFDLQREPKYCMFRKDRYVVYPWISIHPTSTQQSRAPRNWKFVLV